jgi:hypothetical protein
MSSLPLTPPEPVLAWLDQPPPESQPQPTFPPSPRLLSVVNTLQERPGKWARISLHRTQNAARVARWRWRRRFRQHNIESFEVQARELYPGTSEPWAVIMCYDADPAVESAN